MRSRGLMRRVAGAILMSACAVLPIGCASGPPAWSLPSFSQIFKQPPPPPNPLHVPPGDFEKMWGKVVAEVNKHFPIASENRLAGTIRSDFLMTGTLIEPWTPDAVSFSDRLEATLQTLRKYAVVHIDPAPEGGYLVKVEVHKEIEDMSKPAMQPAGRAAFYNDFPVNRTREIVGAIPAALGWNYVGRDTNLEQKILGEIRDALLL